MTPHTQPIHENEMLVRPNEHLLAKHNLIMNNSKLSFCYFDEGLHILYSIAIYEYIAILFYHFQIPMYGAKLTLVPFRYFPTDSWELGIPFVFVEKKFDLREEKRNA